MTRKYRLMNGWIEDEQGNMVAIIPEQCPPEDRNIILNSLEAFSKIQCFIERVERGSLLPKKSYKEFKELMDKIEN